LLRLANHDKVNPFHFVREERESEKDPRKSFGSDVINWVFTIMIVYIDSVGLLPPKKERKRERKRTRRGGGNIGWHRMYHKMSCIG